MSILDKKFLQEWVDNQESVDKVLGMLTRAIQQSAEPDGNANTAKQLRVTYQQLATSDNLVRKLNETKNAN